MVWDPGPATECHGQHYNIGSVRFTPTPAQGGKIPVWVGGVLPSLAGTTWWIEADRPPQPDWYEQLLRRIRSGPAGDSRA